MAAAERGVMTQWAAVPLISLLHFMSVLNKRLGGPGNAKVHGFLVTNDI